MSYDEDNSEDLTEDLNFKLDGEDDLDEPLMDDDLGIGDDDPDNRYH
ncbi:hypothetical protein K8Q98_01435 [Candidatus Nomurabacteria bacterium]|nr:hypothetical protein [Candidatus Nomurabacteria bacterium]